MKIYNQENDAIPFLLHFMIKYCLFVSVFFYFYFFKVTYLISNHYLYAPYQQYIW